MRIYSISTLCLAGVTFLCSCTTTGDPTKGGLFGWSREKAQARQAKLIAFQDEREQELTTAQKTTETLTQKRNRLQREINELKAKMNETRNIAERDLLLKKLQDREAEFYSSGF